MEIKNEENQSIKNSHRVSCSTTCTEIFSNKMATITMIMKPLEPGKISYRYHSSTALASDLRVFKQETHHAEQARQALIHCEPTAQARIYQIRVDIRRVEESTREARTRFQRIDTDLKSAIRMGRRMIADAATESSSVPAVTRETARSTIQSGLDVFNAAVEALPCSMASAIEPVRQDAVDAMDSLATSIRSELTSQYWSLCPSPVVERALARITSAAVAADAVGETVESLLKTRVEIRKVMYDFALEISAATNPC